VVLGCPSDKDAEKLSGNFDLAARSKLGEGAGRKATLEAGEEALSAL
jgi:hypothetical protein